MAKTKSSLQPLVIISCSSSCHLGTNAHNNNNNKSCNSLFGRQRDVRATRACPVAIWMLSNGTYNQTTTIFHTKSTHVTIYVCVYVCAHSSTCPSRIQLNLWQKQTTTMLIFVNWVVWANLHTYTHTSVCYKRKCYCVCAYTLLSTVYKHLSLRYAVGTFTHTHTCLCLLLLILLYLLLCCHSVPSSVWQWHNWDSHAALATTIATHLPFAPQTCCRCSPTNIFAFTNTYTTFLVVETCNDNVQIFTVCHVDCIMSCTPALPTSVEFCKHSSQHHKHKFMFAD